MTMNNTSQDIYSIISNIAVDINGYDKWLERAKTVCDRLNELQPDKPDDGTTGFLAYNVGADKPRMKIKIGRFLTKKLQLNSGYLNDQIIQKIANEISMFLWSKICIELVNGSKITDNYENEIGSSSCMTGEYADYTRLYESTFSDVSYAL